MFIFFYDSTGHSFKMRNQNPFFSGLGALVLSQVWKAHAFPMESTSTSGIVSVPMFVDDVYTQAPNLPKV